MGYEKNKSYYFDCQKLNETTTKLPLYFKIYGFVFKEKAGRSIKKIQFFLIPVFENTNHSPHAM